MSLPDAPVPDLRLMILIAFCPYCGIMPHGLGVVRDDNRLLFNLSC